MIEWLPYLGRVTTTTFFPFWKELNWVTALFRQGYDRLVKVPPLGNFIEWLPYLGRVTTHKHQKELIRPYWVTALFRQGYDPLRELC